MNKQEHKKQLDTDILELIKIGFHLTYKEIGKEFGVSEAYVRIIATGAGFVRKRGCGSPAWKFKKQ